jgi:hypothetical protein
MFISPARQNIRVDPVKGVERGVGAGTFERDLKSRDRALVGYHDFRCIETGSHFKGVKRGFGAYNITKYCTYEYYFLSLAIQRTFIFHSI